MPFIIRKTNQCPASKPYGTFTETGHGTGKAKGSPHGCFISTEAAREQIKALYASVPEAKAAGEPPPNLRDAEEDSTERCESCAMFFGFTEGQGYGFCSGYSNVQVRPTQVCDSYDPKPESEANSEPGPPEVPMTTTTSPAMTSQTIEWRRERARALTESQRKRPETRESHEPIELRANSDGTRVLRSYASLFNEPYTIRAGGYRFEEVVRPGAFKRTLGTNPDVVFRYDHSGPPLARTSSGSLRLGEDEKGFWYEADLNPEDPDVKALIPKVERGDLSESSFAFRIGHNGDKWNDDHNERELLACELDRGDVSIVTFGASRATGKHMLLRSEEAMIALQEIGFERFMEAWLEWRDFTLLPREERLGKVISSQSMETLRQVLELIANADDAVDEAEAMLSDFLGIPNPDEEAEKGEGDVTNAEQLGKLGRSEEERDDPTYEDYDVMYGLKNAKLALASVKACQLCDPDYGSDSDDAAVMAAIEAAEANIDKALVAQAKDGRRDPDETNSEGIWTEITRLATEVGLEVRVNEDGSFEILLGEGRKALSSKARNDLPDTAFALPTTRDYPIHDISHARNALARASGKPEESKVKAAVYKRYPALKPTADRAERVLLLENDSEDLRWAAQLRGA